MQNRRIASLDLHSQYVPSAIYLADADTVEYVRRDVACVYRRIDGILTLAFDLRTREFVGFRLKGFKNFFLTHLKPKYQFLDNDFIALVSVIEQAIQVFGEQYCADRERIDAYRSARKMAHEDRVSLEPIAA
jgi:hypothetical protein